MVKKEALADQLKSLIPEATEIEDLFTRDTLQLIIDFNETADEHIKSGKVTLISESNSPWEEEAEEIDHIKLGQNPSSHKEDVLHGQASKELVFKNNHYIYEMSINGHILDGQDSVQLISFHFYKSGLEKEKGESKSIIELQVTNGYVSDTDVHYFSESIDLSSTTGHRKQALRKIKSVHKDFKQSP